METNTDKWSSFISPRKFPLIYKYKLKKLVQRQIQIHIQKVESSRLHKNNFAVMTMAMMMIAMIIIEMV